MKLRALALSLFALALLCVPHGARAQGVVGVNDCTGTAVGAGLGSNLTVDKTTGFLCTSASATGTFTNNAAGATGSAVPVAASFSGVNLSGTLRGQTGVNPSGSVYAAQIDLASIAGATVNTGNGAASGSLRVSLANDSTGTVKIGGYSFANITTSTTTTVKSGAGTVHAICINTLGVSASAVVIYDNTAGSGTKIGSINSLTLSGCFTFDAAFATGLTLVTTGAPDVTVTYQ